MGSAAVGDTCDTMADTGCDMSEEELLAMLRGIDASKIQSESQVVYPEKSAQAEEKEQVGWVPTMPMTEAPFQTGAAAERPSSAAAAAAAAAATTATLPRLPRGSPPSSRRIACRRPPRRRI